MDPRTRDLADPDGQSPSLTTRCDRESTSASDIEMMSLVSAHELSDQIHNPHEGDVDTVAGVSDPPATLHKSQLHPPDPDIDPRLRSITDVPDKRPSMYSILVMDTWVCETIAMIFSLGCIVAIAFTVGNYDGDPIPSLPSGVTLNALISILSTAARAALFFVVSSSMRQLKWCWLVRRGRRLQDVQVMDEASRGPLGAIKVLAKWTGSPLATLGASITILMIAFSPFLQRLVAYPTDLAEAPSLEAATPRALNYTLLWDFDEFRDRDARGALRDWLSASPDFGSNVFRPSAICARAALQCAWDDYKSIGRCSQCRNTTGHLSNCIVKDQRPDEASESHEFCQPVVDNPETKSIQQPNLMRQESLNENLSDITLRYWTSYVSAANVSTFVADDKSVIKKPVIMFTHVATSRVEVAFQDLYHSDQPPLQIDHITECVLTLCEREYIATTRDGETRWSLTSTTYGKRFQSDSCWRPDDSAEDIVLTSPDGGRTHLNEIERAFCPIGTYYQFFKDFGKRSSSEWHYNLTDSWKDPDVPNPKPARDASAEIASIATALINYGLNVSNQNAIGKSFLPIVIVRVRWQWIALPAALELASAILFLSTVLYSRHVKVPIWKSSLLAICYHEIEDLQEKRANSLVSEMDKASSAVSVQISRGGDNHGFMLRRIRHEGELREERQQA